MSVVMKYVCIFVVRHHVQYEVQFIKKINLRCGECIQVGGKERVRAMESCSCEFLTYGRV